LGSVSADRVAGWKREEQQPFRGWDFSYLAGRMHEEQPPWSYVRRAAVLMDQAGAVLDMGTGGGERLQALQAHWPARVVATEDYAPNVRLATERLAPLGVQVVETPVGERDRLPFAGGEFDLVLNRHSGFSPAEVARVLAADGFFLTQQVHGLWAQDLLDVFGVQPQWPHATPDYYVPRLEAAGLTLVTMSEWTGRLTFDDVGAIVYYLRAVPWLVPGFTVETHLSPLCTLQERLDQGTTLSFQARLYWMEACKAD
jgi:hypothetical protein